jgi:multicomponent Na+:H+ antiporter subunit B
MIDVTERRVKRRHIESRAEMTVIIRTIIRSLLPVVLIFGIYIITYGHLTPGGGFQGGMAIVGAVMSFYLAYGYARVRGILHEDLDLLEHSGALAYLLIGLAGLFAGTTFLNNWLRGGTPGSLFSGGVVFLLNLVVGVKVAAGTLLVMLILLAALQKGEPRELEE